jgi:hypothetical protein
MKTLNAIFISYFDLCKGDETYHIQFFIENQTNQTIKVEKISKKQIQKAFELAPKKRVFFGRVFKNR